MHVESLTPRNKLSLELVASPPRIFFWILLDHWLMIKKRMRFEPIHMRLEVEEEKNLMQQLRKATLRRNLNPT
jgi:hypothetical protein